MTQTQELSFGLILEPYKQAIERHLRESVERLGQKTPLRDACEYALVGGGKRFRPALVLMIAKGLGSGADVLEAAMGIEFFHTASLIADDLPCMDDDDERRNQPSIHRMFGESTALLATYALISAGYLCLARNAQILKQSGLPFAGRSDHLCVIALENASYNTGISGATGGQFLDLFPPSTSLSVVKEVIHKKTVTLFEISFVLGWLFGGGEIDQLDLVKKSAAHFGNAFQIADDLDDMIQDLDHPQSLNIANILGKELAVQMFHKEIDQFQVTLEKLKLEKSDLRVLAKLLIHKVERR